MANQSSIKKLEADLWASADLLRANANLNAGQYCMPVLGLLFLFLPRLISGQIEINA